jgi:hypothetical protein
MNNPNAPKTQKVSEPGTHLLQTIEATQANVGAGLSDDEFTRLLRQTGVPGEAGFAFLSFSDGVVMLSVPEQDLANWYPEEGWIVAEKEGIARVIAEKHGLSLGEPPDEASGFQSARSCSANIHHHLELNHGLETIVVAHPGYLKVRLFGSTGASRYLARAKRPLVLGPDLLEDLWALYQPRRRP